MEKEMLDKSLSYKNIYMKMSAEAAEKVLAPQLPDGFTFKMFEEGDEKYWANIETSVLEFAKERDAEDYFKKEYLPEFNELKKRCVFVCDMNGFLVGTATAWKAIGFNGRQASLHWVAVKPEYQGMGLGKALLAKAVEIFREEEPRTDIWLHTQTWSHTAVQMYSKAGFRMQKYGKAARKKGEMVPRNEYAEAMIVLRRVISDEAYRKLADEAE